MADSSAVKSAEVSERKRLLSDRGQAVALMHFEHVERQVALAVTKASLLVAASAFIVGAYVKVVTDLRIFAILGWADLSTILFVFGGALLMTGFTCALVAAFPRRGPRGERNPLYYGWIAAVDFEVYQEIFQKEEREHELDKNMLRQIWDKSRWLDRMFWYTAISIWFILLGSWVCLIALAFGSNHLPIVESQAPAAAVAPIPTPAPIQRNGKR
jgi:Family of unknown function (DUF5706)